MILQSSLLAGNDAALTEVFEQLLARAVQNR